MRTFSDLGVFGAYLVAKVADVQGAAQLGLTDAAEIIEVEAKARIGTYQQQTGPFNGWAPLSQATLEGFTLHGRRIAGKIELGYAPPDNPLLRTGDMRLSIGFTLERDKTIIGSDSPIAADQEMGTPGNPHPIPPRPFLGPAAYAMAHEAVGAVAKAVSNSIAGLPYRRVRPGDTQDIPF